MPAQLMFGDLAVNARGAGLPLVALGFLAMQASTAREGLFGFGDEAMGFARVVNGAKGL